MTFLSYWPYVLIFCALILGTLLGWQIQAARQRFRSPARHSPRPDTLSGQPESASGQLAIRLSDPLKVLEQTDDDLSDLDGLLSIKNKSIAAARQQYQQLEEEHNRLLLEIDEQRSVIQDAHSLRSTFERSQDEMLVDIDSGVEELEMLERLSRAYAARINNLTQQAQRQYSELQLLHQTLKAKTGEINEARQLIEQRDAELRRLVRQRQQREADIARVQQQIARHNEDLRRLLDYQERNGILADVPQRAESPRRSRKDVTPAIRPRLPSSSGVTLLNSQEHPARDNGPET